MVDDDDVRAALALQLGKRAEMIQPSDELERDLRLQPCDLVLIALKLEELVGVEFPVAALESVKTVGGLMRLAHLWKERARMAGAHAASHSG